MYFVMRKILVGRPPDWEGSLYSLLKVSLPLKSGKLFIHCFTSYGKQLWVVS